MRTLAIAACAAGVAATAVLAGCSDEPRRARQEAAKGTPTVTETERPGSGSPSDISPLTAHLRISDLRVGTALAADGTVAENANLLHAGEVIHASIAVGDVGADSAVKAVWLGPDGQRIRDEVRRVEDGAATLVFRAPDTSGWAIGEYKVEIYLGDELAASDSFDIVAPAPPPA